MQPQNSCKLNHSVSDVQAKLNDMTAFLPHDISQWLTSYIDDGRSQEELNSIFHLLKKYDLADASEQDRRNKTFQEMKNR
ncbi:hypothetical protein PP175_19400 [Aneurinibacillus sp. Ricciae_BoGa-3]|uniref:hypothetical protein n=1 Tax=Aneurinibacillus sp. Ricciae_BoGa-3 TaxID=3022697 RepID=UPI00233F8404|nr:hypothetical protein [Aneurinibacillus sp. Ricciae_BoGa-3]WCK53485.1 hypothetical protein PP175_19400 [Aneurinibacillus sp. Ricciae_BoGa-3]